METQEGGKCLTKDLEAFSFNVHLRAVRQSIHKAVSMQLILGLRCQI